MKILFLAGGNDLNVPTERLSPLGITSTATVYNYFLRRELARIPGIETASYRFAKVREPARAESFLRNYAPPLADHVICLEQRGFQVAHPTIYEFFRARTPGAICAICDHDQLIGPEDYLFHAQPTRHCPPSPKSVQATWAASPEYCYPEKEQGILNILIDHNNYSGDDRADDVVDQVSAFATGRFRALKRRYGFEQIVIRQFKSGGIEQIDPTSPQYFGSYNRRGLPFPEACREYRRADIFFVTKRESMGLSMIECAMAGALVVLPAGYANRALLDPLNHVTWNEVIDFDDVMAALDVGWSARRAAPYNWQHLAHIFLNTLRLHRAEHRLYIQGFEVQNV
jgi:hypothetical protein